jgi:hypothetical protein
VRCSRRIPSDAPGGSCPACLFGLALTTPANAVDPTVDQPVPETLTAAGGRHAESTAPYGARRTTDWPSVPGYQILDELGAGGCGSVYRARQLVANRELAVKVVHSGGARTRFDREVRAMAALEHPHVVRVYEVGHCDQGPFFSMELMPGGSLADRIRRTGPLPPNEAAALVEKAARGVAAVHKRNIAHRDLKPSNILLSANGEAKVADFGLAKEWTTDPTGPTVDPPTPSHDFVGTPAYAAPEQVAGKSGVHEPRTDVYGLGAVLYQALTGEPPFVGENTATVLHRVLTEEPATPRSKNQHISPELEAVCLKCLAKNPAERYGSATEVADDLARWQRGDATIARPIPRLVHASRWAWRRRRAAASVFLVMIATVAAVVAVQHFAREDPDAELQKIRKELQGRGPVVLVMETGRPRWSRFESGAEAFRDSIYSDGACSVEAINAAYVELLPMADVPLAYRLTAEIRHEGALDGSGTAGVYVCYRLETLADGSIVTHWQRVVFNDHPAPPGPGMKKPPDLWQLKPGGSLQKPGLPAWSPPGNVATLKINPPAPLLPRSWRKLVLEVRPSGIQAWAAHGGGEPVAFNPSSISAEELTKVEQEVDKNIYPGRPDPNRISEWTPRGALGLFVYKGQASFRNVIIERLDP